MISEAQRARWDQRSWCTNVKQTSRHPLRTSYPPPHSTFLALKLTSFALHSVSSGPSDLIRSLRTFSFQICGSAKYTRSRWDCHEAGESPVVKSENYFRRTFGKWCLWCRNTHRSGSFHFLAIFIFVDSDFFGSATKGFPLARFIIN